MKKTFVIILALFVCLSMMPSVMVYAAVYSFRNGDWITYNVSSTIPGVNATGSMKVTFSSVSGTTVVGTWEMNVAGTQNSTQFSLNTATGAGTPYKLGTLKITLIIPANLTQGQSIPGMTNAKVMNVTSRRYADASRKCVSTTYSISEIPGIQMTGSFYWDQVTGILLEVSGSTTYQGQTVSYAFTANGTSLWASDLSEIVTSAVTAISAVIAIVGVILVMGRRKPPAATLHTSSG